MYRKAQQPCCYLTKKECKIQWLKAESLLYRFTIWQRITGSLRSSENRYGYLQGRGGKRYRPQRLWQKHFSQMPELSRGADIRRDRYRRSFPKGHRRGQAQQKAQRKGCKGHKKERWNGVPAVQPLAAQNSA